MKHIKSCQKCKEKVIDLISKHKNSKKRVTFAENNINHSKDLKSNSMLTKTANSQNKLKTEPSDLFTWLWSPEIKEIITICLFGFFIIIMLDLLMRK